MAYNPTTGNITFEATFKERTIQQVFISNYATKLVFTCNALTDNDLDKDFKVKLNLDSSSIQDTNNDVIIVLESTNLSNDFEAKLLGINSNKYEVDLLHYNWIIAEKTNDNYNIYTYQLSYGLKLLSSLNIPNPSSIVPYADTTAGSVGNGTTWARSNHTPPKSSLYGEASHNHTKSQITDFPTIPSKTSQLTNDSGYLTNHQDISGKEDSSNKTSTWNATTNNVRYPTEKLVKDSLDNKVDKEAGKGLFSGSYNDLSNKPTIPSKTSQLTNDSGYLTSHQDISGKVDKETGKGLSTNDYTDAEKTKLANIDTNMAINITKQATADTGYFATYVLSQGGSNLSTKINIPRDFLIKSGSVKTVTTANNPVSGYKVGDKYLDLVINAKDNSATDEHIYVLVSDLVDTEITWNNVTGKPTFSTVATSGSYNDLSNKPTIPSKTSQLTNDSSYLTAHQDISGKEDKTNKTTIWNPTTNNTRYPTEKLVKDSLDEKADSTHTHTKSQITDFPSIPSASSTTPSADTASGSVGTGTTWARSNHTHPKSSLYAEANHTHDDIQSFDVVYLPFCIEDLITSGYAEDYNADDMGGILLDYIRTEMSILPALNNHTVYLILNNYNDMENGFMNMSKNVFRKFIYITKGYASDTNIVNGMERTGTEEYMEEISISYDEISDMLSNKADIDHTHSEYINPIIVDNLTTDNSTRVLSARQGKVLKNLVDGKASSTHTHNITDLNNTSTVSVVVTYTDETTETLTLLKQTS